MTTKEIENLLKREIDTLKLIHLYTEEFEEHYGKQGLKDLIDQLLDNINRYRVILKNSK